MDLRELCEKEVMEGELLYNFDYVFPLTVKNLEKNNIEDVEDIYSNVHPKEQKRFNQMINFYKNGVDFWDGEEWKKVKLNYLKGINKPYMIKEVFEVVEEEQIKVTYTNWDEIYYKKVFGTWGDPTRVC